MQVFGRDSQTPDLVSNRRPCAFQEALPFHFPEPAGRALGYEHAYPSSYDDKAIILETLIGFGDGQRIGSLSGGKGPYRWKHVSVPICAVED